MLITRRMFSATCCESRQWNNFKMRGVLNSMDSMEEQGLGDHSERQENKAKRCRNGHVWAKLLLLGIIICGISLLLYETGLVHFFLSKKRILHFLEALGPWSFAGFITLQALQVIVAPIPGEVTGLLGGYLYGPLLGTLLSTFGLTLGSSVAFSLSRAFGRPFVERFVPKPAMDRFDYLLQAKGCFFVFMLFLIPLTPKDYLCYILGIRQSFSFGAPYGQQHRSPLRDSAADLGGELHQAPPVHKILLTCCGCRRCRTPRPGS